MRKSRPRRIAAFTSGISHDTMILPVEKIPCECRVLTASLLIIRPLTADIRPVEDSLGRSPVSTVMDGVDRVLENVPDQKEQVLALSKECDATRLKLSSAEGYLISRIDGATSWRLLREIGGIPSDQVDVCLSQWIAEGTLEIVGCKEPKKAAAGPKSEYKAGLTVTDVPDSAFVECVEDGHLVTYEDALDDRLDINLNIQKRILEFEVGLGRPYHVLLGVAQGADPKTVKRAYLRLSKEFHPDRYFRKEIGVYGERLDRIFKKVLEAHEILSDPELCQVQNLSANLNGTGAAKTAPNVVPSVSPLDAVEGPDQSSAPPRELTKLERLRQRMPFKINQAAIAERRARADEIFRAAQVSQRSGRLTEAEASLRIAISFDPSRSEFKEALGSLRIVAAGARATQLLAKPSEHMSAGELYEALRLLEDVLPYRPHDPDLNERAARVCLQLGKLDDAREYTETLLLRSPESAPAHTLLGRIHRDCGETDEAVSAFEKALKFDEEELEARRALASVRIGARDTARGDKS